MAVEKDRVLRYYSCLIQSMEYLAGKSLDEYLLEMSRQAADRGPNPYLLAGAVVQALDKVSTPWSDPQAKGKS